MIGVVKAWSVWLRHNICSQLDPPMIVPACWHDRIVQLKEPRTFIFNLLTLILNAWGEWDPHATPPPPPPPWLGPLGEGKRRIRAGLSLWCEWEPRDRHNYSLPPPLPCPTSPFHPSLSHKHMNSLSVVALFQFLAHLWGTLSFISNVSLNSQSPFLS